MGTTTGVGVVWTFWERGGHIEQVVWSPLIQCMVECLFVNTKILHQVPILNVMEYSAVSSAGILYSFQIFSLLSLNFSLFIIALLSQLTHRQE